MFQLINPFRTFQRVDSSYPPFGYWMNPFSSYVLLFSNGRLNRYLAPLHLAGISPFLGLLYSIVNPNN
jgi:hypothetical protein